jgi:hypothetical protein
MMIAQKYGIAVFLIAALMLASCGDSRIRPLEEQSDAGEVDASATDYEQLQEDYWEWYDQQKVVTVPWSHVIDDFVASKATVEDDSVSWPLPEFDYMGEEVSRNDLLWAPMGGKNRAFARRVLGVQISDTEITFETRPADMSEMFLKTNVDTTVTRGQPLQYDEESMAPPVRTRRQANWFDDWAEWLNDQFDNPLPFYGEYGGWEVEASTGTYKLGFDSSGQFTYEHNMGDGLEFSGEYAEDGGGFEIDDDPFMASPLEAAIYLQVSPVLRAEVEKFLFAVDISILDPGPQHSCSCVLAANWAQKTDVEIGLECLDIDILNESPAEEAVEAKAKCMGNYTYFNVELVAGVSVTLEDLELGAEIAMEEENTFELFEVPIMFFPGLTLDLGVKLKEFLKAEVVGKVYWEEGEEPRFGIEVIVGFRSIPDPNSDGLLIEEYQPANSLDHETRFPDPQYNLEGKIEAGLVLTVNAGVGVLGFTLATLGIGGKGSVGVEVGMGTSEPAYCTFFTKMGPFADIEVLPDLKDWVDVADVFGFELIWTLIDGCNPEDSLFGLDFCWNEEWDLGCSDGTDPNVQTRPRFVQLRVISRNERGDLDPDGIPAGINDPSGFELDSLYIKRDNQIIEPVALYNPGSSTAYSSDSYKKLMEANKRANPFVAMPIWNASPSCWGCTRDQYEGVDGQTCDTSVEAFDRAQCVGNIHDCWDNTGDSGPENECGRYTFDVWGETNPDQIYGGGTIATDKNVAMFNSGIVVEFEEPIKEGDYLHFERPEHHESADPVALIGGPDDGTPATARASGAVEIGLTSSPVRTPSDFAHATRDGAGFSESSEIYVTDCSGVPDYSNYDWLCYPSQ